MEEHRRRLAAAPTPAVADPWQREAARRWGARVLQVQGVSDWAAYVRSRTARPPPNLPSPYALLQERYSFDPWHLLVACILMGRVSSAEVKDRCLGGFFQACPTPSALLDTDPAALLPILRSLGLFPSRMAGVLDVTQRFLDMPEFDVGLQGDLKIKGVGEFGYHSYLIFCRDENPHPTDKSLASFVGWRSATRAGAPSSLLSPDALLTPPLPNPPPEAVAAAEADAAAEVAAAAAADAARAVEARETKSQAAESDQPFSIVKGEPDEAQPAPVAEEPRLAAPQSPAAPSAPHSPKSSRASSRRQPKKTAESTQETAVESPRRRSPRKLDTKKSSAKQPAKKAEAVKPAVPDVKKAVAAGQRRTIADYFGPSR
jgi:hypothetical protein